MTKLEREMRAAKIESRILTNLEKVRRSRKISRRRLAEISGVGESTIYEAEKKIKGPLNDTMIKLRDGINALSSHKFGPVTLDDISGDYKPVGR